MRLDLKKTICLIAGFLCGFAAIAQNVDTSKTKSSQKVVIKDLAHVDKNFKFLSIVDGERRYGYKIKKVQPLDIINVDVLKQNDAMSLYGAAGANGVVIITTKKYAVKTYQRKLSDFSQQYREYLNRNHGNDKGTAYTINGDGFESDPIDRIMKLYKVPIDKIKTLVITENPNYNGFGNKAVVAITITI